MARDIKEFNKDCDNCINNLNLDLDETAYEIYYLFNVLSGQLRMSFGMSYALDYNVVEFIFNLYEVPDDLRVYYFEWLITLVKEVIIKPEMLKAKNENQGAPNG